jgi:hypothetical protein
LTDAGTLVAPERFTVIVAWPAGSSSWTEYAGALNLNVETSSSLIVSVAGPFGPICGAAPAVRFFGFESTRFTFSGPSAFESSAIATGKVFETSPGLKVSVCAGLIDV